MTILTSSFSQFPSRCPRGEFSSSASEGLHGWRRRPAGIVMSSYSRNADLITERQAPTPLKSIIWCRMRMISACFLKVLHMMNAEKAWFGFSVVW